MQSSEQERVAKARKVEASFSYRMATRRQYLIRWKMFSTKCIRPGKHPVVLGVNGAGVAQAAGRARRGEAALPAWSLAKAPRVRVAAAWMWAMKAESPGISRTPTQTLNQSPASVGVHDFYLQFKGDIHLAEEEKEGPFAGMEQIAGRPFWLIAAGGKLDFTIKWWDIARYQQVVNHFADRLLFVQVGEDGHHHPALEGVIDLRGKTSLRELLLLMYHAQGVVCPVTLLMHLAAAVETPPGRPPNRPCVVVAGGREPVHWEAYPYHQFLHTLGMLECCARGGCWRSRTVALGDGNSNDHPHSLCADVVGNLPRCMDMITAEDVVRAINGEGSFRASVVEE